MHENHTPWGGVQEEGEGGRGYKWQGQGREMGGGGWGREETAGHYVGCKLWRQSAPKL